MDALRYAPAAALADEVGRALAEPGSVGVIVPDDRVDEIADALADDGMTGARVHRAGDDADVESDERLTVVAAGAAKGLEYDSVVLVEPAAIVRGEPTRAAGLRRLYVVLTRAVSRLAVVGDEPLPDEIRD
jgi:DNA helicase IV